jgi:very-short-patch-repair endonuclease
MKIFNKKELKLRRKELRNNATQAEIILWQSLKKSQLKGRKFRRQQNIENYIVDFYCPEEKLVVELDGQVHFEEEQKKYDEERTRFIEALGIRVIRIENQDVLYSIESVLKRIAGQFSKHVNHLGNHPVPTSRNTPPSRRRG